MTLGRFSWRGRTIRFCRDATASLMRSCVHVCLPAGVGAGILLVAGAAQAQDVTAPTWEFNATPYLWIAGMSGKVTDGQGRAASFNQSFADVLSHLNAAVMVLGNARYERWVGLVDFDYVNLSSKTNALAPYLGQTGVRAATYLGTVAGGYRFINSAAGSFDGLAGVRIVSLDTTANFSGGLLPAATLRSSDTWVTPVFALRGKAPLGNGFYVSGYGDAGAGNADDLTWQVYGGVGYNITPQFTGNAGYRYLAIQHRKEGLTQNINEQGPLLGIAYRF
jgi:opacity protein-like surface antigen